MIPGYDATTRPPYVDPIGRRTNMTYDPGPHPSRVEGTPTANDDATGAIRWVVDALGKRVELNPPTPDEPDGDEPIVVIKPS